MKIFESYKKNNQRIIKLFGISIYVVTYDSFNKEQNIFGGLISSTKSTENNILLKSIKIFGKEIIKIVSDSDFKRTYFLSLLIQEKNIKENFFEKYSKIINDYSDIFILNGDSGEIYLFLSYIYHFISKAKNSKHVLFIATKKYHQDLVNLFVKDCDCVYLKNIEVLSNIYTKIHEKNIYSIFTSNHFNKVIKDIKNNKIGESHYFKSMLKDLNINYGDVTLKKALISQNLQNTVISKVQKIDLSLDKFVFIAPEASTCAKISLDFWDNLIKEIKELGFDVFLNITNPEDFNIKSSYKSCYLTFSETLALASMSKYIISLRSGLTELLLQSDVNLFCLYTNFSNRYSYNNLPVEYVMSGFGLSVLPDISLKKLYEINMMDKPFKEVINTIISNI